jgi:hypothetical protein
MVEVKDVLSETWALAKETSTAFVNLIGLLSGDKSLQGVTKASLDNIATAIKDSIQMIGDLMHGIIQIEQAGMHLVNAAELASQHKWRAAGGELGKAAEAVTPKSWTVAGTQELTDQLVGDASQQQKVNRDLIIATAKQLGISPNLALAVAMHESGLMQWDKAGKLLTNLGTKEHHSHAMGLFQLQPETAKEMGVDPTTVLGNVMGGIKLLKYWMDRPGGTEESALEHYYGNNFTPGANQAFAKTIMGMEAGIGGGPMASHDQGDINIYIQAAHTSVTAEDLAREVKRELDNAKNTRIQRNIMEFQGWSYGNG